MPLGYLSYYTLRLLVMIISSYLLCQAFSCQLMNNLLLRLFGLMVFLNLAYWGQMIGSDLLIQWVILNYQLILFCYDDLTDLLMLVLMLTILIFNCLVLVLPFFQYSLKQIKQQLTFPYCYHPNQMTMSHLYLQKPLEFISDDPLIFLIE